MLAVVLDVGSPSSGKVSGICAALGPLLLVAAELAGMVVGGNAALAPLLLLAGAVAFVPAIVGLGGVRH